MADGSLIFDTKIDGSGFEKGVANLRGKAGKVAKGIVKSIGIASTAMSAFGGFAISAGMNFDAGMSEVSAISGATGKDLDMLRQKAKDMGASTKFSATESAEALKYMAMAGWKPQQMMKGLDGVINLAAASGENLGLVSDIVTDSLTAFGMSAEDTNGFVDLLAKTATSTNTNISMLGESFKYIAPVARAAGYTAKDTALALGLLANNGIKGSQAGTVLRSAFLRLAKPTKEVAKGLQLVGLKAEELQNISLPDMLSKLREGFKGLSDSQKLNAAASIFGKEAASGMLAIIETSSEEVNRLSKEFDNSSGAAEKMAKVMNDNLKGDITILKSALEGFGISLYENVDTPLRKVAQSATKHIDKLNETVKKDISKLPKVVGDILGEIVTEFSKSLPKFTKIGSDIIINLLDGLKANSDILGSSMAQIGETIINSIFTIGGKLLITGADIILNLGKGMTNSIPNIISNATNVVTNVLDYFINNIDDFFNVGVNILMKIADGLETSLSTLIPKAIEAITQLFISFSNNIEKFVEIGVKIVNAIVQGLINSLPILIKNADKLIVAFTKIFLAFKGLAIGKKMVSSLASGILSNSKLVKTAGKKVLDEMILYMNVYKPMFKSQGKSLVSFFYNGLKNGTGFSSACFSIISDISSSLMAGASRLMAVGTKLIGVLATSLTSPVGLAVVGTVIIGYILGSFDLSKIFEKGGEIIGSLIRGIVSFLPKLWEVGKSIVKGLLSALNPLNWVKAGAGLVKGLIKGIKGEKKSVENASKETVEEGVSSGVDNANVDGAGKKTIPEIIKGIETGQSSVSEVYKSLIEQGVSQSDASAILYQKGKGSVEDFVRGILDGGGNVKTAYTALRLKGYSELESVQKIIELGKLEVDGYINGVNSNGEKLIDKYKELRDGGLSALDALEEFTEKGKQGILDYGNGAFAQKDKLIDQFKTIRKDSTNALQALDQMAEVGLLNVNAFGTGSANGLETIKAIYQNLRNQGFTELQAMEQLRLLGLTNIQGFTDGVHQGLIPVQKAYQQLKQAGVDETLIPEVLRANGYTNVDNLAGGINSGQPLVNTALDNAFKNPLLQALEQQVSTSNTKGKEISNSIAQGISNGTGSIQTSSVNVGNKITEPIENAKTKAVTSARNMMTNINSNINSGANNVKSSVSTMANQVNQDINRMNTTATNNTSQAMSGIAQNFKSATSDISSSIKSMANDIDSNLKNLSSNMSSSFSDMLKNLVNNVKSASSSCNSEINSMASSMVSTVNSYNGSFYSAGYYLMSGLSNGIYAGRSAVVSASISVMRSAIWAAKSEAGIHSPSKVMEKEVGIMLPRGLNVGINKEKKSTIRTAKNFISGIIDTMSAGVDFEVTSRFSSHGGFFGSRNNYTDDGSLKVVLDGGQIVSVVNLDGREVGRSVTPYVSREIAMDKRR